MAIVAIEHFTRNACFAVIHRILISIYGVLKQKRRCLRTVILATERRKKIRILYTYLRKCRSIFIFQVVIYLLLQLRYRRTTSCRRSMNRTKIIHVSRFPIEFRLLCIFNIRRLSHASLNKKREWNREKNLSATSFFDLLSQQCISRVKLNSV